MAGNGTIGLELVEQLDDIDAVLVPWGGGGLTTGIASALARAEPRHEGVRLRARDGRAADCVARAPASRSRSTTRRRSSTERASKSLLPAMWERARPLLAGAFALSLDETAAAVRLLAERARVVAEGAGALAVAAALAGHAGEGRIVCIVSGGNIDAARAGGDPRGPHAVVGATRPTARRRRGRRRPSGRTASRAAARTSARAKQTPAAAVSSAAAVRGSSTSVTRKIDAVIATAIDDEPGDREAVRGTEHALLVLLPPAQPVVGARAIEQDRAEHRREQGDEVGGFLDAVDVELRAERRHEQECEQHLHARAKRPAAR